MSWQNSSCNFTHLFLFQSKELSFLYYNSISLSYRKAETYFWNRTFYTLFLKKYQHISWIKCLLITYTETKRSFASLAYLRSKWSLQCKMSFTPLYYRCISPIFHIIAEHGYWHFSAYFLCVWELQKQISQFDSILKKSKPLCNGFTPEVN